MKRVRYIDTRDRPEVPEYAAVGFWFIFDFHYNGNCRLGRAVSSTCYLLRVVSSNWGNHILFVNVSPDPVQENGVALVSEVTSCSLVQKSIHMPI